MHPVHEGQFIGLAVLAVLFSGIILWHYIDGLNEEAARAHERAARAEEEIDSMQEEIHHLTADLDEREGQISLLGCEIAELEHRLADNHPDVLHCEVRELKDRIAKRDAIIENLTL